MAKTQDIASLVFKAPAVISLSRVNKVASYLIRKGWSEDLGVVTGSLSLPSILFGLVKRSLTAGLGCFGRGQASPHVLHIMMSGMDGLTDRLGVWTNFPNAKIIYGKLFEDETRLAEFLRAADSSSSFQEVVVHSHGAPNALFQGVGRTIEIIPLLKNLYGAPANPKFIRKVTFLACNVFTNLSSTDVAFYRDVCRQNAVQVTGSTSIYVGGLLCRGRLVRFTPDGQVERSPSDCSSDPNVWLASVESATRGFSDFWFQCHAGKTQNDGAALQLGKMDSSRPRSSVPYGHNQISLSNI